MGTIAADTGSAGSLAPVAAAASAAGRLVMDVGMHRGQDTAYYLRLGYKVLAIEAEPGLAAAGRERFTEAIAAGRLEILNCAIGEGEGEARFWVFPEKDEWNTLDPEHAARNIASGAAYHITQVRCRTFAGILAEHPAPYYIKIDIEGADLMCVRALDSAAARGEELPAYVSLELTMMQPEAAFETVSRLYLLGYRRFKIVDQALLPSLPAGTGGQCFEMGASGPFGNAAPGQWRSAGEVWDEARRCLARGQVRRLARLRNGARRLPAQRHALRAWRAALSTNSWYDLHAAR